MSYTVGFWMIMHVTDLLLNLTKAFDVVNHSLLLSKIKSLCVRGKSLIWVSSHVSHRECR